LYDIRPENGAGLFHRTYETGENSICQQLTVRGSRDGWETFFYRVHTDTGEVWKVMEFKVEIFQV